MTVSKNYLLAIREHVQQCTAGLDDLSERFSGGHIESIEYLAAERLLHILMESAIGLAKQWVKGRYNFVSSSAYESFTKLNENNIISDTALQNFRKMIGLRNTLVHDYLQIDHDIIKDIIVNKYYKDILNFVNLLTTS